ncbi:MAG: transposase [Planctomycetota bacterium]
MPAIVGFHFIFSAYGFWLPNDPRGSWSDTVRRHELLAFGSATKVNTRQSLAGVNHDRTKRLAAKSALKHPPVRFTGIQATLISKGFGEACESHGYRPAALAILPDHVHLAMWRHSRPIEEVAKHLKSKATAHLTAAGQHPLSQHASASGRIPSPWARGYWCPFVRDMDQMERVIRYVEDNPVKAGLPRQSWAWVEAHKRDPPT